MIIAFQIILLIIIPLSFLLIYDPKAEKDKRQVLGFICVVAIIALCLTIMFF